MKGWRLIVLVLSIAWIAAAGVYGFSRVTTEIHRQHMQCYRMQAEAKADASCAKPGAVVTNQLCAIASADCSRSARIEPGEIELRIAIALLPPALIWLFALTVRRRNRRAAT
jgi:hypothetical protein